MMRVTLATLIEAEEVSFPLCLGEVETALLSADRTVIGSDADGADTQHPRVEQREWHTLS